MKVAYQPPNSPDLNILKLGFFRAIQSLQEKNHSRNIREVSQLIFIITLSCVCQNRKCRFWFSRHLREGMVVLANIFLAAPVGKLDLTQAFSVADEAC
ncbi:hypothetical protein H257_13407 [Aphanomyces astaci]|uniref:Uncharacterized protein n=1 Tax=Aphanomyces astaci TaxID=112090 RepID=W4FWU3_APHAT|nr:hypothetical protein H257_13407 [Aphanomyces astaci]ETV71269.1 hypothetical protein H257_13407 [Aphanomyces astaci]|eukprot:XP_009839209.1 hypothetical protein H257_13407 [Aphanomyces astaci]